MLKNSIKWVKLVNICKKLEYGYTTSAKLEGQGPKFLRTTDISEGNINWDTVPYCYEPPMNEEKYLLKNGDILIARAGSVGASIVIKNPPRAVFASYLIRVRPKKELNPFYTGFFLKSNLFWSQLKRETGGSTLPGINATNLSNVELPVPPLFIQENIVDILEKVQVLIKKRKEANRLTDEFLKTTFLEMFGDPDKNLHDFPLKRIAEIAQKVKNENPLDFPNKIYNYIDISSIDNMAKKIVRVNQFIGQDAPSRARQLIQKMDILISTVRPNLNAVALVKYEHSNLIASTGFCVLRPINDIINIRYLFEICKHAYFISILSKIARGASYPAVSDNDILTINIPIPPLTLQNKFGDISEKIDELVVKQEESESELNNLFNSLMQKAFTGELF